MIPVTPQKYYDLLTGAFAPVPMAESVPDFAYNPLNISGDLYVPVIDQKWIEAHSPPTWPGGKRFAVCLSHDVDAVSEFDPAQNLRSIRRLLTSSSERALGDIMRWLVIHSLRTLKGFFGNADPLCEFEKWMAAEKAIGARSTFFFAPEKVIQPHTSDCMYRYDQMIDFQGRRVPVREIMQTLDVEGWEIGLHPSWNANADLEEMKYQKVQIETTLGHEITSVRQHFLKFDPEYTHAIQFAAGFKYDSTLGFNDNVGFRRGTSYPFVCHSVENEDSHLLQIPLIAQDGALLLSEKGLRLDPDTALHYIRRLVDSVKDVGGVLTLSWHPHTMKIPGFWELYERSLELLALEDPWFATVGELGQWWQKHVDIDLLKFTAELAREEAL